MLTRPWTAPPEPSAFRSCCSLTEDAVGLTELGCCAPAGAATARISAKTNAATMKRACASSPAMQNLPDFPRCRIGCGQHLAPSTALFQEAMVSRYAVCQPQAPDE